MIGSLSVSTLLRFRFNFELFIVLVIPIQTLTTKVFYKMKNFPNAVHILRNMCFPISPNMSSLTLKRKDVPVISVEPARKVRLRQRCISQSEFVDCLATDLHKELAEKESPIIAGLPYAARERFADQFELNDLVAAASRFASVGKNTFAYCVIVYGQQICVETDDRETEPSIANFVALMEGTFGLDENNLITDHVLDVCRMDIINKDQSIYFAHGNKDKTYHEILAFNQDEEIVSVISNDEHPKTGEVLLELPVLKPFDIGFVSRVVNATQYNAQESEIVLGNWCLIGNQ